MTAGCGQQKPAWDTAAGVLVSPAGKTSVTEAIKAVETAVPLRTMQSSGLAGAMGGVRLNAFRAGSYDVRLPLPQMIDGQTPVCYSLNAVPETALTECRVQEQRDGNTFVTLKLNVTKGQQIVIEWSSVILIAARPLSENRTPPEACRAATACVQSDAPLIRELAEKLWPATGGIQDYAANIQAFIRDMKLKEQPMSLDALGILDSGDNRICTANANLACALMRAKQIPCRSVATLPTISRRFEMHRVVEYFDNGAWISFDPSSVNVDIPLKPWQNTVMAKTTVADEQAAMKPRAGAMPGCPFGQEIEFSRPGLGLSGQDFFWTIAAPLAEFEVTDEAAALTAAEWSRYLRSGTMSAAQLKAASARGLIQYLEAMKAR
ncbi:transglutaminase domain-containing protein [bacterium]|nr:transglutaminase domain-containing protein [bacterium]